MRLRLYDFMSHARMHLPFNSGFLTTLRAAYPDAQIDFYASAEHLDNLAEILPSGLQVNVADIQPYEIKAGQSRHSPRASNAAAKSCLMQINADNRRADLSFLLGAEAGMVRQFRQRYPAEQMGPLVYVLHNYLGAALNWRSRNPYLRYFDFLSEFRRPLPAGQYWACLETYIQAAAAKLAPQQADKLLTLPHPIVQGEERTQDSAHNAAAKIGFLGFCSRAKGFARFVACARELQGSGLEFHAIGIESPDCADLKLDSLSRKPTKTGLTRSAYLEALSQLDYVLLPLGGAYAVTASGTLMDAITAHIPVILPETAIFDSLSPENEAIGPRLETDKEVVKFLRGLIHEPRPSCYDSWQSHLRKIAESRRPENLRIEYKSKISAILSSKTR